MDAPLWGDTGGHTGAAPTKLHHTFTHNTSGAEMHRALPPPLLKIKKCVYRYDLDVTVDDIIHFKASYSFGAPWMTSFVLNKLFFWCHRS